MEADAQQIGDATEVLQNIAKNDGSKVALRLIARIDIAPGELVVRLCSEAIAVLIKADPQRLDENNLNNRVPFQLRKRGVETKIILADAPAGIDETLINNIAKAQVWFEWIKAGESFKEVAAAEGMSKHRIQQMIELAFLAPDIVRDVLAGQQPVGFTSNWFKLHGLPAGWQEQRARIASL